MILEISVGIVLMLIIIYLLWRIFQKSVSFYAETEKGKTTLHVMSRCDAKKITVIHKDGKEITKFVRTDISRGEEVEFVYPATRAPQRIIVECENGIHEYEVD